MIPVDVRRERNSRTRARAVYRHGVGNLEGLGQRDRLAAQFGRERDRRAVDGVEIDLDRLAQRNETVVRINDVGVRRYDERRQFGARPTFVRADINLALPVRVVVYARGAAKIR